MSAELAHIDGRADRARFAIGCVRVALFAPRSAASSSRLLHLSILISGSAVVAIGLYSQKRIAANASTGGHGLLYTSCATGLGLALIASYVLIASRLARTTTRGAVASRRCGVASGVFVGAVVLVASTPVATALFGTEPAAVASTAVSWLAVAVAVLGAGRVAARAGGDRRAGRDAGLWAGMTAGFVLVVGLLIVTFGATAWVAHDPAMIKAYRDSFSSAHFASYHTHYATIRGFVESENSDTALLGGLIWLPIVSAALGFLGGVVGASRAVDPGASAAG